MSWTERLELSFAPEKACGLAEKTKWGVHLKEGMTLNV